MSDMANRKLDQAARLQQRKEAVLVSLPPFSEILRGSVFVRSVRCGKPSCHCASGEGHHRAYVGVTFAGGRTEQITVPRELIPLARRWIVNYQRWWRAIERVSQVNRQLLRERLLTFSAPGSERLRRKR